MRDIKTEKKSLNSTEQWEMGQEESEVIHTRKLKKSDAEINSSSPNNRWSLLRREQFVATL
jgi:hypothetical protein